MVTTPPPAPEAIEMSPIEDSNKTLDVTAELIESAKIAKETKEKAIETAIDSAYIEGYKKVSVVYAMHGQNLTFEQFKQDPEKAHQFVADAEAKYNQYMTEHAKDIKKLAKLNEDMGCSLVKAKDLANREFTEKYYAEFLKNQAMEQTNAFIARFDSLKDVPTDKLYRDREATKLLKGALGYSLGKDAEFGKMMSKAKMPLGEFLKQEAIQNKIAQNMFTTQKFKIMGELVADNVETLCPSYVSASPTSLKGNLRYARGANTTQFNVIDGWKQQKVELNGFMISAKNYFNSTKSAYKPSDLSAKLLQQANKLVVEAKPKATKEKVSLWSKVKALFKRKSNKSKIAQNFEVTSNDEAMKRAKDAHDNLEDKKSAEKPIEKNPLKSLDEATAQRLNGELKILREFLGEEKDEALRNNLKTEFEARLSSSEKDGFAMNDEQIAAVKSQNKDLFPEAKTEQSHRRRSPLAEASKARQHDRLRKLQSNVRGFGLRG